jgi:hypothetical protein
MWFWRTGILNVMRNSGSLKGCNGQYIRSRLDTNTVVENQDERQEKAGSYWYFGMMELWIRYHWKKTNASNPIELAEYAVANKIAEEPDFAWWVKDTLWKWNQIIAKIKSRYWKITHKFGLKLPHSIQEALQIDEEMETNFWDKISRKKWKMLCRLFNDWMMELLKKFKVERN